MLASFNSVPHGLSTVIPSTRDNLLTSFEHVARASFDYIRLHGLCIVQMIAIDLEHQLQQCSNDTVTFLQALAIQKYLALSVGPL